MIRILLVDDDVALQNIYRAVFPLNSIDIVGQVFDGADAVKIIKDQNGVDVVVMDQRMPIMDGITATKKILELDDKIRILFLSADEDSKDAALAAGAKFFLTKPVSLEDLIDAITKITTS